MTPEEASVEADRRELLAGYEFDEPIEARFGPGTFGHHELLDRAHLIETTWSRFVREHPACFSDPQLYQQAWRIESLMAEFYQAVVQRDAAADGRKPLDPS